jgi:LCP family protein required for cell wall assembly
MYILGIGADNDYNDYLYGLADVIRIARVDFVTPKITVLTIPRDLWVEFPGIKEKYAETVTHGKINQAYLYGGPGMGYYEGEGGGPGLLAYTIAHNYGLYVDHYAAVNMVVFQKIIDALGGIDIYLDQDWDGRPVDENTENMGYFEAGQWHMSGDQALRFARIRKKYSEVTRTDNQTLVLCAVKDKVLKPSVIARIPQLINSLIGEIQTDLTPEQIRQLACVLTKLEEDNLQFIRFPDEMMVQGRIYDPLLENTTFVWDIPKEDIQAFIRDFENDAIPPDSEGGMSCP